MTEFILNDRHIKTSLPAGMSLLSFIRDTAELKGTKSGCKEGDCGACTVMEGEAVGDSVNYRTVASCVYPLGNAHGKHIVTVEGLSSDTLNPVQQSLHSHNGTQCGFCTPGIVVSLTNYILSNEQLDFSGALEALAGNICRCTGYKSIERAAKSLIKKPDIKEKQKKHLPEFFTGIAERLKKIHPLKVKESDKKIAGGTDLLVQKPHEFAEFSPVLLSTDNDLKLIRDGGDSVRIGAAVTVSKFTENILIQKLFPNLRTQFLLISSEQIRNMATFGGNLVNASPIGDLSIFLLAADAMLHIKNAHGDSRETALRDFYKSYKNFDLQEDEIIESIEIKKPQNDFKLNFEKVSKRKYLDIASVNSCLYIESDGTVIHKAALSAGGIGPVPFYAKKTSDFLCGEPLDADTLRKATEILNQEISPISDIRGSEKYKRLLLRQLFVAHFRELFPKATAIDKAFLKSLPTV